jgi:zinc transport system ATP-binding protein
MRPAVASSQQHVHGRDHAHDCGHAHHGHDHDVAHKADALLSARGISVTRNGRVILERVSIDISAGEIVTLIGPNGAGKTTLVRVLLGLETADQGTIRRQPSVKVGYVPQRFDRDPAIPITVDRFLILGAPDGQSRLASVLEEVGARHVAQHQLSALSGGELQRVVLARALLRNSTLLVLDEPVRGVDYSGEAELYSLIGHLRTTRGLGVLLVSHDLHVVMAQSDRIICLNRHICCSGVPESVAQHPEYARLFGDQAARAFALYHHTHDHRHDLAGDPKPQSKD